MDFYEFKPTLEHLALAKMTTGFWSQGEIISSVCGMYESLSKMKIITSQGRNNEDKVREDFVMIEGKVMKNVRKFKKFSGFKSNLISKFVKSIGQEMLKWMIFIHMYCEETVFKKYLCKLQWTAVGFVDGEQMAKEMVWDEAINTKNRFNLACRFCLSDDIRRLWAETDLRNVTLEMDPDVTRERSVLQYWKRTMMGENAYDDNLFLKSVIFVSESRYFFRDLEKTKPGSILKALRMAVDELHDNYAHSLETGCPFYCCSSPLEYNAECFLFLLSKARKYGVDLFNREMSIPLLVLFLEWPLQSEFESVMLRDGFLETQSDTSVITSLLATVFLKMDNSINDCDYLGLLNEFWKKCPLERRREFMEERAENKFSFFYGIVIPPKPGYPGLRLRLFDDSVDIRLIDPAIDSV